MMVIGYLVYRYADKELEKERKRREAALAMKNGLEAIKQAASAMHNLVQTVHTNSQGYFGAVKTQLDQHLAATRPPPVAPPVLKSPNN